MTITKVSSNTSGRAKDVKRCISGGGKNNKLDRTCRGLSYLKAYSPPPHSCRCSHRGCCCCCRRRRRLKSCRGWPDRRPPPAAAGRRIRRASTAPSVASPGTPAGCQRRGPSPTSRSAVALLARSRSRCSFSFSSVCEVNPERQHYAAAPLLAPTFRCIFHRSSNYLLLIPSPPFFCPVSLADTG